MFAHPNFACVLRPCYSLYVLCLPKNLSWSFGTYLTAVCRLRFVKRLRDFKWKFCARKLIEGAARFPVNNWTPLKHKHAKEQMHARTRSHSQARAAWGQISVQPARRLPCPLPGHTALHFCLGGSYWQNGLARLALRCTPMILLVFVDSTQCYII